MGKSIEDENYSVLICISSQKRVEWLTNLRNEQLSIIAFTMDMAIRDNIVLRGFTHVICKSFNAQFIYVERPVKKILIFEDEFATTFNFIKLIRNSLNAPINVVTRNKCYPVP
ncbi:hypothetical protein, partial [Priestia megaterium]